MEGSERARCSLAPASPASRPAVEPRVGDRLGPYFLQSLVGEGGMGRVFRAVHDKLGRIVAIKLLRRSASCGAGVQRFLREARFANRVRHPGVVEITDIVEAPPGGDSYYVMEWLEGKNLRERMRELGHPLPLPEILRILSEAADALQAVHEADLVHRDLKPENIFLVAPTSPGRPERVKVIDFGVALDLSDPKALLEPDMVGTPSYVAPEQAQGGKVDARSDIYALGVILYEMVVGRLPFTGDSAVDVIAQRLTCPPLEPRRAAGPGVHIPRRLEHIILRCLQKDPAQRYQSMAELRRDLEDLRLHPPLFGPRIRKVALLAAGGLILTASAGALWMRSDGMRRSMRGLTDRFEQRLRPPPAAPPATPEPMWLEVQVDSSPSGAQVRYQGKVLGITPCVVRLPEGQRRIELQRAGYRTERHDLQVRLGARLSVRLSR
ncbi:MAG: serine/threonine-protein kinase [Myxococcales bacterium]|nr:serine/threonine-protein kinase [Myxococcales bacterium]